MAVWSFGRDGTISLRELQGEFDRLVDRLWHGGISTAPLDGQDWGPPIDVCDESDRYVLQVELPGLTNEDLEVAVLDRTATVSGVKPSPRKPGEGTKCLRSERRFGKFKRTIELPEPVDETRVHAAFANGLLTVSLPKKVVVQGRKVPVESGE
ncbi:MAG: Hsp20/alpha crystallin family protein [Phycisphaerae bacterium]|nr:Hsp20/alpha crystallin family protein [Phycisphaerae bacterium]NUQ45730.1 Hsp20/alpha crystallin family protein [Phycisphaerae bacterium]